VTTLIAARVGVFSPPAAKSAAIDAAMSVSPEGDDAAAPPPPPPPPPCSFSASAGSGFTHCDLRRLLLW
jgi:hypothetical protein